MSSPGYEIAAAARIKELTDAIREAVHLIEHGRGDEGVALLRSKAECGPPAYRGRPCNLPLKIREKTL